MDFEILCNNDFWKKKLRKAFENQDVDKDGFISRADYDLIISRYKEMGGALPNYKTLGRKCTSCGELLITL